MTLRTRALLSIVALSVVDVIIPVPILGILLVYAILSRPAWARSLARELLSASQSNDRPTTGEPE